MKKNLAILAASGLLAILIAPYVSFAGVTQTPLPAGPRTVGALGDILCTAINWVFTFLLIIAVIFALVAAFKYLTAAGDPEKVKSASHTLVYAAVAVGVALIARGVPFVVNSIVSGGVGAIC